MSAFLTSGCINSRYVLGAVGGLIILINDRSEDVCTQIMNQYPDSKVGARRLCFFGFIGGEDLGKKYQRFYTGYEQIFRVP